jgi:hypothetical protein
MQLGRLRELDLRTVWSHEALELTPWLLDNDDVLAEVLGLDLELSAAEHPVGSFAVDLLGRDLTNDCVLIVENQLTPTDHDHLGKLITYAAGTDARTIVWLAPQFREEHREALDLLNNLGGDRVRFFGVELAVVSIGESAPAPLLRIRAQPNDWHSRMSSAARVASQSTGKAILYQQFWERCLERVRREHPGWTRARKPGGVNWLSMPSPFKGEAYILFCFGQNAKIRVELYIDSPVPDRVSSLFAALEALSERLEGAYGGPLHWDEGPNRRASRIVDYADGDITDVTRHDSFMDWFLERGTRLRAAVIAVASDVRTANLTVRTPF